MADTTQEGPRGFAVFLRNLGDGKTETELSEALQKLCVQIHDAAVMRAGECSGSLTLKLDIAIEPSGVTSIAPTITTKEPKPKREKHVAWLTPKGGNVVFEPPRQGKLPLYEVPVAPVRTADVSPATQTTREA